ncbi:heparan-alpha-glucosaminide N-acetyltransferase domain-containing protein [Nocardiopsis sp. CT-R113]|uniref:Heparan-alpha-glucosaminide N-acetyltransferase domain-containing protein n=1 Tax=Nocardiopsis codii TaxID=3065942 RepID=A0ABU7KGN8_9ACTN|nr:heparan-alpha-glucosaminide N-acetyltransferase domain-containing protein [Nocardiopsis sp. CT-R113]MEE2041406.1 heparan-alpha-glucosaminide N-acetyltransferase domain-containing protein [Nocardiopsis sp. CT-R113]
MAQNQSDDTSTAPVGPPPPQGRIDGIDAARAIAVFGMFVVHLGVGSMGFLSPENYAWDLHSIVRGNSSALFALLAGVSLAMMTGRTAPVGGEPLLRAIARILTRAVLIGLLGAVLDIMAVPIAIILTYYAGFFLLALPLVKLRPGALWAVAGGLAVVGPFLSFALREAFLVPELRSGAVPTLTEFFLTGYYPAVTFMVYVVAGMALGRLDLTATAVRLRLAVAGAALSVFAYGGSWLMLGPLGGLDRLVAASGPGLTGLSPGAAADPAVAEQVRYAVTDHAESISGQVPTDSWWWLAVNTPHTGTTFEIAEAVGQGLIVLVACMFLCDRFRVAMYPLTSVGRMPLTVYSGHILALAVVIGALGPGWATPWLLEWFVLGALVFATLWRLVVGRGPAELLLGEAADGVVSLVDERRAAGGGRPGA